MEVSMTNTDKELVRRCDEIVATHDLLDHPFYQAWSNGTLPVDALTSYAAEYGAFIGTIGDGWKTLGRDDIAKHEAAHARIWQDSFAGALGTSVGDPGIKEVDRLVNVARTLFKTPAAAVGALYAFESQQPRTAASKLKGLRDHYQALPESCGRYFELHSADYDEVTCLRESMAVMNEGDQAEALAACDAMSRMLFDALTGIYEPFDQTCASGH